MGALFGVVIAVVGLVVVLPRVLRRPAGTTPADGAPGGGPSPTLSPEPQPASPSRGWSVGRQEPLGGATAGANAGTRRGEPGWQPEMGEGFHQTTAYPEPPPRYEEAERLLEDDGTHGS